MAQVLKLPRTPAGRQLIRDVHSTVGVWIKPPAGQPDVSEVDWDDLAVEIENLFAAERRGQS